MIEYQKLLRPHKRQEDVKSRDRLRLETVTHKKKKRKRMAEIFERKPCTYSLFDIFLFLRPAELKNKNYPKHHFR